MRFLFRCLLAVSTVCIAAAAFAGAPVSPADVSDPVTWGTATRVTRLHHLWFADQPDVAGFEAARAAGVRVVINLRPPSELDWDEKAAVEKLGMAYYNVPVSGPRFERDVFGHIEELVEANEDVPILLHCSTSNRVGGWLATHLVREHNMTVDAALAVGRRAGITKEEVADRVREYVQKHKEGETK
jgi:protein tyrosine phosphatase (PTP) superfamily phosphohydrolase (DUF442 family)